MLHAYNIDWMIERIIIAGSIYDVEHISACDKITMSLMARLEIYLYF